MQGDLIQQPPRTISIDPCCLLPADLLTRIVQRLMQGSFPISRPVSTTIMGNQVSLGTVTVDRPNVTIRCQPSLFVRVSIPVRWTSPAGTVLGGIFVSGGITVRASVNVDPLSLVNARVCVTNPRIVSVSIFGVPMEVTNVARGLVNAFLSGRTFCFDVIP